MYTKFLNLEPEKQEKIINAAMKEFADKGYDQASTNEIVKSAEISKGILFHYFKNKKQLFLFLYDYAIEKSAEVFFKSLDSGEVDFFKKLKQVLEIKLDFLTKYPDFFHFMEEAYSESSPEVKGELEKRNQAVLAANIGKIFENVDTSKFREGIDLQKAIRIITWTSEGMTNDAMKRAKYLHEKVDFVKLLYDYDSYARILKECFYK